MIFGEEREKNESDIRSRMFDVVLDQVSDCVKMKWFKVVLFVSSGGWIPPINESH